MTTFQEALDNAIPDYSWDKTDPDKEAKKQKALEYLRRIDAWKILAVVRDKGGMRV